MPEMSPGLCKRLFFTKCCAHTLQFTKVTVPLTMFFLSFTFITMERVITQQVRTMKYEKYQRVDLFMRKLWFKICKNM